MKWLYAAIGVLLLAGPAQADQPTFWCGLIGPPFGSGYRILASNPWTGKNSSGWLCTVTCVMRMSKKPGFTGVTCTRWIPLGAKEMEICRDGPGLSGAPFSKPVISNFSCQGSGDRAKLRFPAGKRHRRS